MLGDFFLSHLAALESGILGLRAWSAVALARWRTVSGGMPQSISNEVAATIAREVAKALRPSLQLGVADSMRRGGSRSTSSGNTAAAPRPNDWVCGKRDCGYSNFARRQTCRSCGAQRRGATSTRPTHPSPTTSTGRTYGSTTGGGVSEGRSFATAARGAVPLGEFVRQSGKAADRKIAKKATHPSGEGEQKPNWFDLTVRDEDTVVGDSAAASSTDGKSGTGTSAEAEQADSQNVPLDMAALQEKLNVNKAMLRAAQQQGLGPGDSAFDGAKKGVDQITARMAEKRKHTEPSPMALVRARRQLDKALAARSALDDELIRLQREFEENVAKLNKKYEDVDMRIASHESKVNSIKHAFGGHRPPCQAAHTLRTTTTCLGELAPQIADIINLVRGDPRYQDSIAKVEAVSTGLSHIHNQLSGAVDSLDDDVDEYGFVRDPEDDGDSEDGDDEDDVGDDASMDHATDPAEQQPTAAAEGSTPPAAPTPAQLANCGLAEAAELAPPAVKPTGKQTKPTFKAKSVASKLVEEIRNRRGVRKDAGKTRSTRTVQVAGGATAPMPAAMHDTSEAAQEGNPLMEGEGAAEL